MTDDDHDDNGNIKTPNPKALAQDDSSHDLNKDDISERGSGSTLRRRVTWADGTAEPQEVNIAISIPRHKKLKAGYHVYSIEVWQEGRSWLVRRRYSQFLAFHEELLEEELLNPVHLPKLPPKHIFHMRHFSKRAEDRFVRERKGLLQDYVRHMLKIEKVLERSFALQAFLEIDKTRLNSGVKPKKSRRRHEEEVENLRFHNHT